MWQHQHDTYNTKSRVSVQWYGLCLCLLHNKLLHHILSAERTVKRHLRTHISRHNCTVSWQTTSRQLQRGTTNYWAWLRIPCINVAATPMRTVIQGQPQPHMGGGGWLAHSNCQFVRQGGPPSVMPDMSSDIRVAHLHTRKG
jgi:hypothetical protein